MKRKFISVLFALVLVLSLSLVTAAPAAAVTNNVPLDYDTIQEAINAADPGDIITVDAGIYAESLTVDEEVSIIGAGPTTIIDPAVDADGITITADNVLIKDLKVSTEYTGGDESIAILITGTDGVEINTVTIETTGDGAHGIYVGGTASSNLGILDCNITVADLGTAIMSSFTSPAHSGWIITGNTLSAAHVPGVNLELYDVDNVLIDDNEFMTSGSVSLVYSSEDANVGSATISNNTFYGSGDVASVTPTIWVESTFATGAGDTSVDGVTITGNTFNNWYNAAIKIGEGVAAFDHVSNVAINSNIFNMTTAYPAILDHIDIATGTGNIFNVSSPATIQDAVDSAFSGETINVAAGTYVENLVIATANITLEGAQAGVDPTVEGARAVPAEESTIDAAVSSDPVIEVAADNVTIDGFTITGATTAWVGAITINDVVEAISDVTISSNIITGNAIGIRGDQEGVAVDHVTIDSNKVTENTGKGILFYKNTVISYITISGNEVTNNGDSGISFYGVGPNIITGNIVSGNAGNGISIKYDDGDVVSGNIVTDNDAMGINVHESTNALIEDNTVSLHLSPEVVTTFWGGTLTAGKGSGIYVHEASDNNTIRYNNITGNNNGVLFNSEGGNHPFANSVYYNNIADNTYCGIKVYPEAIAAVDAINNWWGNASGPSGAGVALGTGDAVNFIVSPLALYGPDGLYVWLDELAGYLDDLRQLSEFGKGADLFAYNNTFGDDILTLFMDLYGDGGVLDELGFDYPDGELNNLLFTFLRDIGDFRSDLDDFTSSVDFNQSLGVLGIIVDDFSADLGAFYGGLGAFTNTNVNYDPWLLEVVVEGLPPTTYDKTLALKDGWTLVSTDKEVTATSDWVGTTLEYKYIPGGGYTQATVTNLEPVSALYLKTVGGGGVGINYSTGAPTASEKQLLAGWNLISSASWHNAYLVLSSLRYAQIGDELGPGLATLVSQGDYNQFTPSFNLVTFTEGEWAALRGIILSPFDGYWVYMNAGKSFGVIPD